MGDSPSCTDLNCPVKIYLTRVLNDLEKRMDAQVLSDQRALELAEKNIGVRLDNLNHWRAETLSERKEQASRREVEDIQDKLLLKIAPLERFQDKMIGILAITSILSGAIGAIVVKVLFK